MPKEAMIKVSSLRDIITARSLARQLCKELAFDELEQARVTAAISEVADQISAYVTSGMIHLEPIFDQGHDRHGIQVSLINIAFKPDTYSQELTHLFTTNDSFAYCKQIMDHFSILSSSDSAVSFTMIKWKS